MSAPAFRILKRESKETPSSGSGTDPRGLNGESGTGTAGLTEEAYEKARAEILGQDYDCEEKVNKEETARPRSSRKAQYRGLDNSEFDPDYLRVSPFVPPVYQAASGFATPQQGAPSASSSIDPYPSLLHAYGTPSQPHRR